MEKEFDLLDYCRSFLENSKSFKIEEKMDIVNTLFIYCSLFHKRRNIPMNYKHIQKGFKCYSELLPLIDNIKNMPRWTLGTENVYKEIILEKEKIFFKIEGECIAYKLNTYSGIAFSRIYEEDLDPTIYFGNEDFPNYNTVHYCIHNNNLIYSCSNLSKEVFKNQIIKDTELGYHFKHFKNAFENQDITMLTVGNKKALIKILELRKHIDLIFEDFLTCLKYKIKVSCKIKLAVTNLLIERLHLNQKVEHLKPYYFQKISMIYALLPEHMKEFIKKDCEKYSILTTQEFEEIESAPVHDFFVYPSKHNYHKIIRNICLVHILLYKPNKRILSKEEFKYIDSLKFLYKQFAKLTEDYNDPTIYKFLCEINEEINYFCSNLEPRKISADETIYDSITRIENMVTILGDKTRLAKDFQWLREYWDNEEFERMFNKV